MNKFHNQECSCSQGHIHDSKKEARRCNTLYMMQESGLIENLEIQKPFVLIPTQYRNGKCIERKCKYIADFVYTKDGEIVAEDVKGYRKGDAYNLFAMKRKLMLQVHGIRVIEI